MSTSYRHHSLFWPIILIGVGITWLLVNLNVIASVSMNSLIRLWPLILIVIGLDLLFGHKNAWTGALVGLLTIGAVVGFLVFGPSQGWTAATNSDARVETFTTPLEKTTSAVFLFDLSSQPVNIHSLNDSGSLIDAEIGHTGTINYAVAGSDKKTVHISQSANSTGWLSFDLSTMNLTWDLGITPEIPLSLTINGGSGSVEADLSSLKLSILKASMGSGSSDFTFPESTQAYDARIQSGSGSINISLPARTSLTLEMDCSSGAVNINLPVNAAVRVEVTDSGSGSLNLPGNLQSNGGLVGEGTGSWQTSGYDKATYKILIKITNRGSGSINIH